MVAKGSKKSNCEWCNRVYFKTSNAQKYCSPECKHNARLITQCKATAKHRRLFGRGNEVGGTFITNGNDLVNVSLGATRKKDPKEEYAIVHKVFRKLGLRNNNNMRSKQCKNKAFGQV